MILKRAMEHFIDIKRVGKPIIGVKPRSQERIPTKVSNNADVMVGWNSNSVVQAVRDYAL